MALGDYPTAGPDFHDQFTETSDVDPISDHTPTDAGTSWTNIAGNSDEAVVNATNDAVIAGNSGAFRYNGHFANISGGWSDDHTVEASGAGSSVVTTFGYPAARLRERTADSQAQGYTVYHNAGVNFWQLIDHDQSLTVLQNLQSDSSPSVSDVITIQVIGDGASADNIACFLNGTQIGVDDQDNSYTTGQPGFIHRKTAPGVHLDNFKAWDEGGGVAANPKGPLGHPLYGPFKGPIG